MVWYNIRSNDHGFHLVQPMSAGPPKQPARNRQTLDISTNIIILPFPGREITTTTLREAGKAREPLRGADSAFQHGATEMELGRTTINTGDAETPCAHGRGGVVGWAQPGGYGEEEGEGGCCSVLVSPLSAIHLRAPQNHPWSFFGGGSARLVYDLCMRASVASTSREEGRRRRAGR